MAARTAGITRLVNAASAGDSESAQQLLAMIYDELRAMAQSRLKHAPPGTRLQPTELVHEAYLRLFQSAASNDQTTWSNRGHFFAAAAQAMRNILVEQHRQRMSIKRGGGRNRVTLNEHALAIEPPSENVLALDELLTQLERVNPRKATIVLLHCFSGLTLEETAAAMDLSLATVEREWRFTRALLQDKLEVQKKEESA